MKKQFLWVRKSIFQFVDVPLRWQKFGRKRGDFYIKKRISVYANLTTSVTKIVFTKQLRSEIFRSLVISFCITCEFVKLIVIKLTNFSLQHGMVRIISCITILQMELVPGPIGQLHFSCLVSAALSLGKIALYSLHYFIS